jgi:ABC-2 type transport system ATP-binding protein
VIEVEHLTRIYHVPIKAPGLGGSLRALWSRERREVRAVDGIDFTIRSGERVAFLGPNGAGKTTTLKMLSGLLVPTSGRLDVLGFVPSERSPELLRRITLVMGQKQQLLWDLPPRETFELNRALFDLDRAEFRRTLDELVALLELDDILDRPTRNLSLGERMKCELAAALLHRPDVLFLDEPTIGLDVRMQATVRRFIADWTARSGAVLLLTSHYMDDVSALCPRVIVIDGGHIRFDGALDALSRRYAPHRRVVVQTDEPPTPAELERVPGFVETGGRLVAIAPKADVKRLVDLALRELPVTDLTVEEPPLEEAMASLFRETQERRR